MNLKDKTVVIDNKTYRYSKIVMLPTNESSVLSEDKYNRLYLGKYPKDDLMLNQHLYFLSSDKICEGNYYYSKTHNKVFKCTHSEQYFEDEFKVISSTDESLNLPKPSDSFLKVYIDTYNKGEKIEECLVEYEEDLIKVYDNIGGHSGGHWEFNSETNGVKLKTIKGEITIRKVKDSWSREEVIEFAEKYARMVQEKEIQLNTYKAIHNRNWIEENL